MVVRERATVNRCCGCLSGPREGLHLCQSSGRPSTAVIFGHMPMLVEDVSRNIIPLFVQQNSTALCAVIFLQEHFPRLQKHTVVLYNRVCHYRSTRNRDEVFLSVCSERSQKKRFPVYYQQSAVLEFKYINYLY